MKSLQQMQLAWQTMAENRIVAAQDEGHFEDLPGYGRPLEEIIDISDPLGWARRAVRDCVEMKRPLNSVNRSVADQ